VSRVWPNVTWGVAAVSIVLIVASSSGGDARANEVSDIASAFDDSDFTFNIILGVDYAFQAKRAAIKRELSGATGTGAPVDTIPIVRDLLFSEDKHLITPHVAIGLFRDVQLRVALPIVLSLNRSYEFDQSASPCVLPGSGSTPTCVDRTNSSTLIDGLLPDGSNGKLGYDANDPATNFDLNSKTVFRSVGRSGLDTLNVGLSWAPMNQARDDTLPTWILTAEFHISIGKLMKFSRLDPQSQTGVAAGAHEFRGEMSVSKRTSWAEPFVVFWWQAPFAVRGDNPNDPESSAFWNVGFGQRETLPQQQAGTMFGLNATLFENPKEQQRISLELMGTIMAHFAGQGYSEIWEILAYAGDIKNDPNAPLGVNLDPTRPDNALVSHPGTTTIENYMTFAGRIGVNGQVGPHAKLSVAFELGRDQTHAITYDDAGAVFPMCGPTHAPPNCEATTDNVVTPGTREVNPLHKSLIDVAGRRFIIDDSTTYSFLVSGQLLF
jgi:hypothetical protein